MLQFATNTQNELTLLVFKKLLATHLHLNGRSEHPLPRRKRCWLGRGGQHHLLSSCRSEPPGLPPPSDHDDALPGLSVVSLGCMLGASCCPVYLVHKPSLQLLVYKWFLKFVTLVFSSRIYIFLNREQFSIEILYLVFYFLEHVNHNLLWLLWSPGLIPSISESVPSVCIFSWSFVN